MKNIYIVTTLIALTFVLIVGIVIRYTSAADVTATAEITNTAPTVDTLRVSDKAYTADLYTSSGILPAIGADLVVHINGQITDLNGEADIASSTLALVFHRTTSTNTCTADKNDCYRITTCDTDFTTGDDTQISYNCEVPLAYWIDATDAASDYASDTWTSYLTVNDIASAQGTLSATIEVNSLLALNIPTVIDYSTRSLGEQSSSTTNVETILSQRGNTKADVEVSGTVMNCSVLGSLSIAAQKWSLTDTGFASSTTLTDALVATARNINLRTDDANELAASLYWNIGIPTSGVKGQCTGANTIAIVAQQQAVVQYTVTVDDRFANGFVFSTPMSALVNEGETATFTISNDPEEPYPFNVYVACGSETLRHTTYTPVVLTLVTEPITADCVITLESTAF